jgi:hypothetical protein
MLLWCDADNNSWHSRQTVTYCRDGFLSLFDRNFLNKTGREGDCEHGDCHGDGGSSRAPHIPHGQIGLEQSALKRVPLKCHDIKQEPFVDYKEFALLFLDECELCEVLATTQVLPSVRCYGCGFLSTKDCTVVRLFCHLSTRRSALRHFLIERNNMPCGFLINRMNDKEIIARVSEHSHILY